MAAKRGLDFVNVETASQLTTLTDEHLRIILDCMGVKSSLGLLSIVIRAVELRSNDNDNVPGGYDELPSEANIASALCLKNGALSLDFGNMERSSLNRFAATLTDDDVSATLICIDAQHCLRRLKLQGCLKIVGSGLEPLRGSLALEQIDLSTESPVLSDAIVLPIIESILDARGNSLKYIRVQPFKEISQEEDGYDSSDWSEDGGIGYELGHCLGGCWYGEPPLFRLVPPEERVVLTEEETNAKVLRFYTSIGYSHDMAVELTRQGREGINREGYVHPAD
ncbi:hypothetical protein ACHAXR_000991, partial [Thalassiosira sp. AJA248-18]